MSELRSASFWVGHMVVIFATMLGVYLAASVGFKQALKLDLLQADRGTYFVSESLYQEIVFNNDNMLVYLDSVKGKSLIFAEHIGGIKLNNFMFQAAEESDSVFEIAPDLLCEVSQYYFTLGNALDTYYNSKMESPAALVKVVKAETEKLRDQETLVRLREHNDKLATILKTRGVPIAQN